MRLWLLDPAGWLVRNVLHNRMTNEPVSMRLVTLIMLGGVLRLYMAKSAISSNIDCRATY